MLFKPLNKAVFCRFISVRKSRPDAKVINVYQSVNLQGRNHGERLEMHMEKPSGK